MRATKFDLKHPGEPVICDSCGGIFFFPLQQKSKTIKIYCKDCGKVEEYLKRNRGAIVVRLISKKTGKPVRCGDCAASGYTKLESRAEQDIAKYACGNCGRVVEYLRSAVIERRQ